MFGQAVCCFLAAMLHLLWRLLERIWPSQDIELAPEFPSSRQTSSSGFDNNPWAPSKVSERGPGRVRFVLPRCCRILCLSAFVLFGSMTGGLGPWCVR